MLIYIFTVLVCLSSYCRADFVDVTPPLAHRCDSSNTCYWRIDDTIESNGEFKGDINRYGMKLYDDRIENNITRMLESIINYQHPTNNSLLFMQYNNYYEYTHCSQSNDNNENEGLPRDAYNGELAKKLRSQNELIVGGVQISHVLEMDSQCQYDNGHQNGKPGVFSSVTYVFDEFYLVSLCDMRRLYLLNCLDVSSAGVYDARMKTYLTSSDEYIGETFASQISLLVDEYLCVTRLDRDKTIYKDILPVNMGVYGIPWQFVDFWNQLKKVNDQFLMESGVSMKRRNLMETKFMAAVSDAMAEINDDIDSRIKFEEHAEQPRKPMKLKRCEAFEKEIVFKIGAGSGLSFGFVHSVYGEFHVPSRSSLFANYFQIVPYLSHDRFATFRDSGAPVLSLQRLCIVGAVSKLGGIRGIKRNASAAIPSIFKKCDISTRKGLMHCEMLWDSGFFTVGISAMSMQRQARSIFGRNVRLSEFVEQVSIDDNGKQSLKKYTLSDFQLFREQEIWGEDEFAHEFD